MEIFSAEGGQAPSGNIMQSPGLEANAKCGICYQFGISGPLQMVQRGPLSAIHDRLHNFAVNSAGRKNWRWIKRVRWLIHNRFAWKWKASNMQELCWNLHADAALNCVLRRRTGWLQTAPHERLLPATG
jgi:hypothetical protein